VSTGDATDQHTFSAWFHGLATDGFDVTDNLS
jgi:hypothetical protein